MSISLSGIGAIGKEQLISSCSNGEPNWSYIPTKGESSKTQAEFVSEIRELARQAAMYELSGILLHVDFMDSDVFLSVCCLNFY